MFSNTTLTYKCWLETGTGMHIGLGTKCICICLMLGVYEVYVIYVVYVICVNVMYCAWYMHFFNVLKLKNYDNNDVLMMLYNLMNNGEYVVNVGQLMLYIFIYFLYIPIYVTMNILIPLLLFCIMVSVLLGYRHSGRGALVCGTFRRWWRRYTSIAIV
jgi:hypothetical protein